MRPDAQTLRCILESAVLAPSADNRHRLRFELRDDAVRLLSTDTASWAALPHRKFLALLAFGAVVENMALRASEFGYATSVDGLPAAQTQDCVATLRWAPTDAAPDRLAQALAERHTNRRFYRRETLPPSTLAALAAAAEGREGAEVRWLDGGGERRQALQAIRLAESERFRRPALHAELFDAIRFDVGWHGNASEGLPPAALQVEWPMRGPFALLRHWPLMRLANRLGAHQALAWRAAALPCMLSPHLGLIVVRDAEADLATLQAGRAFQRLWLAATLAGLALQPMAAATAELHQRAGDGWVDAASQARLQRLLEGLCGSTDVRPVMLFRLGRAARPQAVAGRRPLADYLA